MVILIRSFRFSCWRYGTTIVGVGYVFFFVFLCRVWVGDLFSGGGKRRKGRVERRFFAGICRWWWFFEEDESRRGFSFRLVLWCWGDKDSGVVSVFVGGVSRFVVMFVRVLRGFGRIVFGSVVISF